MGGLPWFTDIALTKKNHPPCQSVATAVPARSTMSSLLRAETCKNPQQWQVDAGWGMLGGVVPSGELT